MANNIQSPENQASLNDSLDLISKESGLKDIPAYKLAKSLGIIEAGKKALDLVEWEADIVNQAIFDAGAQAYNLVGVPLNQVGKFFGYNPGFSGERFMHGLFPATGSPRGDVDRPPHPLFQRLGIETEAPLIPHGEQPLVRELGKLIDSNVSAPVTTVKDTAAVNPYTEVWEEYLTMPEENQASIFKQLTKEEQNALTQYVEENTPPVIEK